MQLKKLQDCQHNIIDIAKPRSLTLLSMVQTTSPIDRNVTEAMVKFHSTTNRATSVSLAKRIQPIKDGAVLTHIEPLELPQLVLLRFGGDVSEKRNVIVGVEAAEVPVSGRVGFEDLHMLQKTVVGEKGMGHANPVRLHRVPLAIIVISHFWVVEITHLSLHSVWTRC